MLKSVSINFFSRINWSFWTISRDFRKISTSKSYEEDFGYICCIEGEPQNNDYLEIDYYEEIGKMAEEQPSVV